MSDGDAGDTSDGGNDTDGGNDSDGGNDADGGDGGTITAGVQCTFDALTTNDGWAGEICAISNTGELSCPGDNPVPALPAKVEQASGEAGITGGCAVLEDGTAWCWGTPSRNLPGSMPSTLPPTPTKVTFPALDKTIAEVAVGMDVACARTTDGMVACWGRDDDGQIGDLTSYNASNPPPAKTPTLVNLPQPARSITAGFEGVCAILADDTMRCWGDNTLNALLATRATQCRDPCAYDPTAPTQFAQPVESVVLGMHCGCALDAAGVVRCWGDARCAGNGRPVTNAPECPGASGTGCRAYLTPQAVVAPPSGKYQKLVIAQQTACALASDSTVWCWGDQLGPYPQKIPNVSDAKAIGSPITILRNDGSVWDIAWPTGVQSTSLATSFVVQRAPTLAAGTCACSTPGQLSCDGICADLATDRYHCGACDHGCTGSCVGGICN